MLESKHGKPNILWICTDQQCYDTIYCLNNPYIHKPNLDRLCGERQFSLDRRHRIFTPDNSPELRRVMDGAFEESLRNGMKVTRIQMDWPDVEPTKGTYEKQELIERLQFPHSKGLAIYLLLCTADTDELNYPKDLLAKEGSKLAGNMKPNNPYIDKLYYDTFGYGMPKDWTRKLCDWLKGLYKTKDVHDILMGSGSP